MSGDDLWELLIGWDELLDVVYVSRIRVSYGGRGECGIVMACALFFLLRSRVRYNHKDCGSHFFEL